MSDTLTPPTPVRNHVTVQDEGQRFSGPSGSQTLGRLGPNVYRTSGPEDEDGDDEGGDDGVLCSQMLLSVQLRCPLNHLNVVR